MDRRMYLVAAAGATAGIAGCTALGGPGESDDENRGDDENRDDGGSANDEAPETDDSDDGDDADDGVDESEEYPTLVGTFDDFEDLDEWWEWQDIGSLEADTDRAYEGSQSALLTSSPESDGQVRVRRELDEPIDVREVAPGLALATDTDQGVVRIQLQDENINYVEYSTQFSGGGSLTPENFGVTRVRGDPDLSEVVVLQVIRWFGDDAEGRQWVDDFHFVPKPDRGAVLLQFYGGHGSHHTEALPRVSASDFPATAFVTPDRLREDQTDDGDRLTREQLKDLADAGWTIGALPGTSGRLDDDGDDDWLEATIVEPIEWLADEGYAEDGRFFAYPNARATDESAAALVREHYDLAFAGRSQAQGYAGNPHRCSVLDSPTESEAAEALEQTARWNGITSLGFSDLDDDAEQAVLEEVLERLERYVSAGELDVITPTTMAEEYVYRMT
jgi:hypothetical protein